jgi:magnesium transporter
VTDAPKQVGPEHLDQNIMAFVRHEYLAVEPHATVEEILQQLRHGAMRGRALYLYVTDEDKHLLGVIPTRVLLSSEPQVQARDLMVSRVVALPHSVTLYTACEFFVLYRFLAFPIVDDDGRMQGVVDVNLFADELFDVAHTQAVQDLFQLIGVHVSRKQHATALRSFRDRFPWLLANIAGGVLGALLVSLYDLVLEQVLALAFFIPLVLTLAESVSIQSMTLALQRFHSEPLSWRAVGGMLGREVPASALLGAGSAFIVFLVGMFFPGTTGRAAVSIGLSILVSMIVAATLGVALPALVRAVRGDPRVASGPIVLAATDTLTLLVYLNLAALLLARN